MIAFGPVPSRRLGQSLGINNIPPKSCSFDCVYCQVGPTTDKRMERRIFHDPSEVVTAVEAKLKQVEATGARVDYLSFVPDGEPTLDINLGREIELLRPFGKPIAVFTNSSLLWRQDVRRELASADWVSLKMDAVEEAAWRRVNCPHEGLKLDQVLDGARAFAREFQGELATETMLIEGVNDAEAVLQATARFIAELRPHIAYIGIPTRPPRESWARAPKEEVLNAAYQIFAAHLPKVEFLIGFSDEPFAVTGDPAEDLLGITAVHPMREEEVSAFLQSAHVDRSVLDELIAQKKLIAVTHGDRRFYVRRLGGETAG